jgi:hypothetical protein
MPQASLSVAPTPIHLPSANGRDGISRIGICGTHTFMLPFSPDTIRWRRAALVELRKLGIDL